MGDAFGVDRIDYLLRDSYHAGVAYGRFDHHRLIDTLRILPPPPSGNGDASTEPTLGVERGGLESAEALLLARYMMFSQVYFHHIRRIYDIHLQDFMRDWLPGGEFPVEPAKYLSLTDNEVLAAIQQAARDASHPAHGPAQRISKREHFKVLYRRHPDDAGINPDAAAAVFQAAIDRFGTDKVKLDSPHKGGGITDFPVLENDGSVVSSLAESEVLRSVPQAAESYVFADPEVLDEARSWLKQNKQAVIEPREED